MSTCLNRNHPDFKKYSNDFGEVITAKLTDEVFNGETPDYNDFIKNKEVRERLGLLTQSQIKDEVGFTPRKNLNSNQKINLHSLISRKNNLNKANGIREVYLSYNINKVGEADLYSWGVRKVNGDLDTKSKLDRELNRKVDPTQVVNRPSEGGQMSMFQKINFNEVTSGVDFVFESNPELANIGTQSQYSQYLKTIFPDSDVDNIFYHGGSIKTGEEFKKTDSLSRFFFTPNKTYAQRYAKTRGGNLRAVILNISNLKKGNLEDSNYTEKVQSIIDSGYDGIFVPNDDPSTMEYNLDEYVVFDPSQIHTLGSKQDVEGFKAFVNKYPKVNHTTPFIVNALNAKYRSELGIDFDEFYDEVESTNTEGVSDKVRKQVLALQSAIDVDVVYENITDNDGNPVRGMVRTEGDKPVVVLNPEYLADDTVSHEFAHIFIDILGGLNNARINAAVEKLRGTDLWNEVEAMYPELNEIDLAKEVLATAMGKKGAEIFEDGFRKNWWDRFVDWFFNMLGIKMNTSSDIVKDLTLEMFDSNKLVPSYVGIPMFQKIDVGALDKKVESITEVYEKFSESLNAKIRVWKGKVEKSKRGKYLERLKKLDNDVKDYLAAENKLGVLNILKHTIEQYNTIIKKINNQDYPSYMLNLIEGYKSSFDIIKDINTLYEENPSEFKDFSDVEIATMKQYIGEILRLENTFNNKLNDYAIKLISYKYASMSTRMRRVNKLRREQEFLKNNEPRDYSSKEAFNSAKNKYIEDYLEANKEKIQEEEFDWFEGQLRRGYDITEFHRILDSGQVNSTVIQTVQKILDRQDMVTAGSYVNTRKDLVDLHDKLGYSGLNQETKYKGIITVTDDATYLIGPYKPELYETRSKLLKMVKDAEYEFGEDSDQYKKAESALIEFDKENYDQDKPIDKWVDPRWSKLNDNEKSVVKTLKEIIKKDDTSLMGYEKLKVNTRGTLFYRLPFVEKPLAQRVFENNFKDTVSRTLGDITKKRSTQEDVDAFDVSTIESANENIKEVYTTEDNEIINRVPVYFRKPIDKKNRSYDVFTLILMNHFTSQNYKNKFEVSADLELINSMLNVDNKKYVATKGAKTLISKLFDRPVKQSGQSKEQKMLDSILEHRLYGLGEIERFDGKLNKAVSFVNGWASSVMLGLNYFSMVPNFMMGNVMNLSEALGGNLLNTGNLKNGHTLYWKDFAGITNDVGKIAPKSKTNLLMDFFEVLEDSSRMGTKFIDTGSFRKFMKKDSLFFTSHLVEHNIQGVLMYGVLDNLGLLDKIKIDNGKISFKGISQGELLRAKQRIKKAIADAHGQYDGRMKSHFQREALGGAMFMFRKWLVRGTTKRWRGVGNIGKEYMDENLPDNKVFYSEESEEFEEGTYTTVIRFMRKYFKDFAEYKGNVLRMYNTLTDYEKGNVKKTLTDMASMAVLYSAYLLLNSFAEDEDDEDYQQLLYLSAYWFRRTVGEVGFWLNPFDAINIMRTPAASMAFIEKVGRFAFQVSPMGWEQFERRSGRYETGDYKVLKRLEDITPAAGQIFRYHTAQDALSYLNR